MASKRLRYSVLVFGICVLAFVGVPVKRERVIAGGGAGAEAASNGDVDGDGRLSVTDAIYLLRHLFQGGPEPVAFAAGPEPIWPPRVSDIVNVQSQAELLLRPGLSQAIYEVPAGKWLVVSDVTVSYLGWGRYRGVQVEERLGDTRTIKLGDALFLGSLENQPHDEVGTNEPVVDFAPRHFSSPTGIVFAPGSKVQLVYADRGVGGVDVTYNLVGYLTTRQ